MKTSGNAFRSSLTGLFALLAAEVAWAQTTTPARVSEGNRGYGLVAIAFVIALIAMTGLTVKLYDMKRKREARAVTLQSHLSDTLLSEPAVAHLPVTPTVHVPFGRHGRAVVELSGKVPSPILHELVLRLVEREATRMVDDHAIEDRIFVDPQMSHRAA